jgi:hypothetical protein
MSSVQNAEVESQKDSAAEAAASLEFGRSAVNPGKSGNPIPGSVDDEAQLAAKVCQTPHNQKWVGLGPKTVKT